MNLFMQGVRQDLSLPTVDDVEGLKCRLVEPVVDFLIEKFKAFVHLKASTSNTASVNVPRSTYTPLEVLDRDEAKASENIHILLQIAEDRGRQDRHDQGRCECR
uniref:Uncharacterized protein n=1 Tax=Branchiostoma floridae TaxID=7739 RepID=C3ZUQ5_BRAFL|eukprot:XP_002587756.1 hypothetical protein BRAFLDRAFT_94660 [Branchiostoma floridae]